MKVLATLIAGLLLTACSPKALKVLPSDKYLVDLEVGLMCKHRDCYDLSLIVPSYYELRVIRAYELDSGLLSWNEEQLINVLLEPPGGQYQVKQIAKDEYELPANVQTNVVYDLLKEEFDLLYMGKGDRILDITNSVKGLKMNDPSIEQPNH